MVLSIMCRSHVPSHMWLRKEKRPHVVSQKNKEQKLKFPGSRREWQEVFNPNPNPDRSARLQLKSNMLATLLANK